MTQLYNKLSPETFELLVMLGEEAAEIQQAVSKALRHGLNNMHPDIRPEDITESHIPDNRYDIARECGDLIGVMNRLVQNGVLDNPTIYQSSVTKMDRSRHYMHHSNLFIAKEPE